MLKRIVILPKQFINRYFSISCPSSKLQSQNITTTTVKDALSAQLKSIVALHFLEASINIKEVGVELSSHHYINKNDNKKIFVDYQTSIALRIGKSLKLNPILVADRIISYLQISNICACSNTKGFINFTLTSNYICTQMRNRIVSNDVERLSIGRVKQPKKVVFDYSSPNVAKEMHVVTTNYHF
jgi:arginyl-tRNA synthetase